MNLTEAQTEAVNHSSGHLQLIACAGSGKTEVISRRIANLIVGHGIAPASVIAFTFTEKAAAELKDRITRRVREAAACGEVSGLAEMFVGTIHGFCLDLLQTEVPQFLKYNVLDEVQQHLFIDRYSNRAGLTSSQNLRGTQLRRYIDTRNYVKALSLLREAELDEDELDGCSVVDGLDDYKALLHEKRYLDFTGIMEEAAKALQEVPEVIAHIESRVKHVIVDEYQDLNPLQEQIVDRLRQLGADLCVVGDDDQTIYQWRGSDIRNIITFTERYAPVKQIKIQENFRSSEQSKGDVLDI